MVKYTAEYYKKQGYDAGFNDGVCSKLDKYVKEIKEDNSFYRETFKAIRKRLLMLNLELLEIPKRSGEIKKLIEFLESKIKMGGKT